MPYSPEQPLSCTDDSCVERVAADCRRVGLLRDDDVSMLAFDDRRAVAHVVDDEQRSRRVERIRNWLTTLDIHLAGPLRGMGHQRTQIMHSLPDAALRSDSCTG